MSPDESRVWNALGSDPVHVDELAHTAGLAPSGALAALLGLELRGAVESLPGKQYRRT
ncbi:MAG: hypothetical protein JO040_02750 [Gemmatimonadetes bacterium]|nr:hypothetical protein [Gemmatimonadota bacterium]